LEVSQMKAPKSVLVTGVLDLGFEPDVQFSEA
jgi:hypothetical protein